MSYKSELPNQYHAAVPRWGSMLRWIRTRQCTVLISTLSWAKVLTDCYLLEYGGGKISRRWRLWRRYNAWIGIFRWIWSILVRPWSIWKKIRFKTTNQNQSFPSSTVSWISRGDSQDLVLYRIREYRTSIGKDFQLGKFIGHLDTAGWIEESQK